MFLLINIVFLMWVAALPFPTALLAEGLSHYDAVGRQAVVAIYTGMFLVGALLFNLEWWYAIYHGRLLGEGADPGEPLADDLVARIRGLFRCGGRSGGMSGCRGHEAAGRLAGSR